MSPYYMCHGSICKLMPIWLYRSRIRVYRSVVMWWWPRPVHHYHYRKVLRFSAPYKVALTLPWLYCTARVYPCIVHTRVGNYALDDGTLTESFISDLFPKYLHDEYLLPDGIAHSLPLPISYHITILAHWTRIHVTGACIAGWSLIGLKVWCVSIYTSISLSLWFIAWWCSMLQ